MVRIIHAQNQNFALHSDFEYITSSSQYPQSNGFCERMVGVIKPILKKAKCFGNDPMLALLCYRSTPIDSHLPSPAELLFQRKIRSNLSQALHCNRNFIRIFWRHQKWFPNIIINMLDLNYLFYIHELNVI